MIITIKKLRFKNFLSYGNNWTELCFEEPGIILVSGVNASGKSTIQDALSYGLFGKTIRVNKPQLINSINQKELEVQIELTRGTSDHFLIRRGQKPNLFEIYKNECIINQDSASKDYQQYLETDILGLNYKTFYQTVVLSSSSFVPFMQLPLAGRREIIEDVLGISVFSKMRQVLKSRLDENKGQLNQLENEYKLQKERISQFERYQKQLNEQSAEQKSEISKKIADIKIDIEELDSSLEKLLNKRSSKQHDRFQLLENYKEKQKTYQGLRDKIRIKLQDIHKKQEFFSQHQQCPFCEQTISEDFKEHTKYHLKSELNQIEPVILESEQLAKEVSSIEKSISQIDEDIYQLTEEEAQTRTNLRVLEKTTSHLLSQLDTINRQSRMISNQSNEELYHQLNLLEESRLFAQKEQTYLISCQELLKDSGLKLIMIQKYLPKINQVLNQYLSDMGFFVSFAFDENFNETIKSRYRDVFSFGSFSEGEKARINLAILFTWRYIARLKHSTSCNVLFLDEVFSSVLDKFGTEQLMNILNTEGQYQSILIISHADDILKNQQYGMSFSKCFVAKKVKNFSSLHELSSEEIDDGAT